MLWVLIRSTKTNSVQTSLNSIDDKLLIFFLFFPENRIWKFMQIVSIGDNLHEMSNPVSGKNKKNISVCRLLKILPGVLSVNIWSYNIFLLSPWIHAVGTSPRHFKWVPTTYGFRKIKRNIYLVTPLIWSYTKTALTLCSSSFISWSHVFCPAVACLRHDVCRSGTINSSKSLIGRPRELLRRPDAGMASSNTDPRSVDSWKRKGFILLSIRVSQNFIPVKT